MAVMQFDFPAGVCMTQGNHIIVADFGNNRLQEIASLGEHGDARVLGKELLQGPLAVALTDAEDALIVLEDCRRVVVLSRDAKCILRVLLDIAGLPRSTITLAVHNDVVTVPRPRSVVLLDVRGTWKRTMSGATLPIFFGVATDQRGDLWISDRRRLIVTSSQPPPWKRERK